jgi:hypothetical protein
MSVEYRMNVGPDSGINQLRQSPEMQRFMLGVGNQAAKIARQYALGDIRVEPAVGWRGRRAVTIRHLHPRARAAEWGMGSTSLFGLRPLRHALDWVRAQDANRRLAGKSRFGS